MSVGAGVALVRSAAAAAALLDAGGGVAGTGVPHDHQGLDEERERHGAPDGRLGSVAGVAGAMSCFPVALDGSMGHRQEYRSATAAGDALVSRLKSPRS